MPKSPPLALDDLQSRLSGARWAPVRWVPSTGSTNADVAAAAKSGAAPGLVTIAEHQARGAGRLGRQWESPAGACIALSVLVRPTVEIQRWTWLPLIAGMAVAESLTRAGVAGVGVKWPNDVLVDGRKICGILSELVATRTGHAAVLGMGLNVSLSADELPVPTATSVVLEGCAASKAELVAGILNSLDAHLTRFDADSDLSDAYASMCSTIGRPVRVEVVDSSPVEGRAQAVDELGRLAVDTGAGIRWFAAGDVHHLR